MIDDDQQAKKDVESTAVASRWTKWDRGCLAVVLLPLLCAPFVVSSAAASWQNNNNDLSSWADDALPLKQQFKTFVEYFGRPELVVISWPGCHSDSEQLVSLAKLLAGDSPDWFVKVSTPQSVLKELQDIPGASNEADIREQLKGILIGPDGLQGCLVAELGPAGRNSRPEAIEKIKCFGAEIGVPEEDLKLGGMGPELAALDYESVAAPARLAPITGLCMALLCILFLRSIPLGLFVTALGTFSGVLSAAIIHWCGVQSNAVLATLPTLGGLLTISLALHFIGYYRNARQEVANAKDALKTAFQWAWKPTLISAITTALGLGSLMLSRTLTIRQFGLFGAIITIVSALLALSVVPAFLRLAGHRVVVVNQDDQHRGWLTWVNFIQSNARAMIAAILCVAIFVGAGLRHLKTGVHLDNLFVANHEIIQHDQWLESQIGPLSTLEIVLSFPRQTTERETSQRIPNLAKDVAQLQMLTNRLRATADFSNLVSLATGVPNMEKHGAGKRFGAMARLRKWLNDNHKEILDSGFHAQTNSHRHWRVSVRFPAFREEATSELRLRLKKVVDEFLVEHGESAIQFEYFITGLPLLFEQIERQFLEDLLITYIGGLILISLTVFLVLRSAADAATAMIPNVLPAVGVLGGISLLGIRLDVGSVMTASIALGVAVDDTLHFVLWYQRQRTAGAASRDAVRSSVMHCGAPILQTSIICGTGLAILGVAPFLPTARFGSLIALMLFVALIGDLLFLPAMLSVRRGKQPVAESENSPQA